MRSVMGVFARELGQHVDLMMQIFLRGLLGTLILFVLCHRVIDIGKFWRINRAEAANLVARAVAMFVVGVALGSYAFIHGNYVTTTLILALPTTALVSRVVYREVMSWKAVVCVLLSFVGAATIILKDGQTLRFDWPLVCALLAALSMSWGILAAGRQSASLSNIEATLFMMVASTLVCLLLVLPSVMVGGEIPRIPMEAWGLAALAGAAGVAFIFMSNHAAPRLHGVTTNNILALQPFFGALIGYVVYGDVLTLHDWLGGGLIVVAAFGLANSRPLSTTRTCR